MNIISHNANDVRIENGKIIYEVSGYLESVKGNSKESYIIFNTGESYLVDLYVISESINRIGMNVTIQVSIDTTGKIKAEYLDEYEGV